MKGLETSIRCNLKGDEIQHFDRHHDGRTLEDVLSRLRRIASLLDECDEVGGLTAKRASELDRTVCRLIVQALSDNGSQVSPMDDFAGWLAGADYHLPVEVFTVNYDLVLETALEVRRVPYFDGFVGALRARFRTDLVEANGPDSKDWLPAFLVRLWKLHGSVNWEWRSESRGEVVRLGAPVTGDSLAAIYPSDAKYDESRRVPFVVLHDRFRHALHQPETLMLIGGYSFGDEHLNEMIFEAARRRQRSEYLAFCFDGIPSPLANAAAKTPNLQAVCPSKAIIGGRCAEWNAPNDTSEEIWADGGFALGDFARLAQYLAGNSPLYPDVDAVGDQEPTGVGDA